jgi:hypothetical protein
MPLNDCLRRVFGHLFHLLAQTQWPHISPNFFDVLETLHLWANLARVLPAKRVFAIRRPDRVLLFVIDYRLVSDRIFSIGIVDALAFPPIVVGETLLTNARSTTMWA